MSLGRFFSNRDMLFIKSTNAELIGDIIQNVVVYFKVAAGLTKTNIYGETSPLEGKFFYPGVEITMLREGEDVTTENAEFGPNRKQNTVFKFREETLKFVNIFPEIGDIIKFNERYYEVDNVVQEQFLGGQSNKSLSIIVNTHYTTLSKLSIMERQI